VMGTTSTVGRGSKTCPECGKRFQVGQRGPLPTYCSMKCRDKVRHRRIYKRQIFPSRRCDYCGEIFHPRRIYQRFCREQCRSLGRRAGG